jgi:ketosteroid isomerase-like protein
MVPIITGMKTPVSVFHEMHALVRAYDIAVVDCYAPGGAIEMPFAPSPLPKRMAGRDAIRAMLAPRYLQRRAMGLKLGDYQNLVIHETVDPEVIVAEFEVDSQISATKSQRLAFAQVYRVVDGLIEVQRDYFDSYAMVERLRMVPPQIPEWLATGLAALRAGDVASYLELYADDAVHEFPFADASRPAKLEGKPAIAAYMTELPKRVRIDELDLVSFREVGDELIIEAIGKGIRADDSPFHVQYVWFISHANRRITRFRDYMHRIA